MARVRALEHDDARVGAQLRVELAVADVDRVHARGAALQQAVGEAAGRRADVEADAARGIEPERVERARELLAAARHVAPRCRAARAAASAGTSVPGLSTARVVDEHLPGQDRAPAPGCASRRVRRDERARRGA